MGFKWFVGQKQESPPAASEGHIAESVGVLDRLKAAVSLTGKAMIGQIAGLLKETELTDERIDEIEEILLRADTGLTLATGMADRLRARKDALNTPDRVMAFLERSFRPSSRRLRRQTNWRSNPAS